MCGNTVQCDAVSWEVAGAACRDAEARLCTPAELEADTTRGTGCSLDRTRVWSGSTGPCGEGQALVVAGSSKFGTRHPNLESRECLEQTATAAGRCCADVTLYTGNGGGPSTPGGGGGPSTPGGGGGPPPPANPPTYGASTGAVPVQAAFNWQYGVRQPFFPCNFGIMLASFKYFAASL